MLRLEQVRAEIIERFERVDRRLAQQEQRFERLNQRVTEVADRIDDLRAVLGGQVSDVGATNVPR